MHGPENGSMGTTFLAVTDIQFIVIEDKGICGFILIKLIMLCNFQF
jgi:hypothetical protein